ncbi:hypothetical protein [Cupriavidus sp. UYPR2.512]|uniref:hypothetical protein n=1 Tax=Cupriavidus sp. UYPR2.512 TaxID=1080187 RepID=UPI0003681E45|nr:hypothetical protein [Cupriavidus sp. UYPR2.512]UIF90948.1 hypothetical protein KAF44_32725 [Cupriavidus necator]
MKQLFCAALAALAMYGCAMPNTTVQSGQGRPTLRVVGAPPQSVLVVDGIQMGQAAAFDGAQSVLKIEEGPHQVEIRQGSRALLTRSIFAAGGESVSIEVSAEQPQ